MLHRFKIHCICVQSILFASVYENFSSCWSSSFFIIIFLNITCGQCLSGLVFIRLINWLRSPLNLLGFMHHLSFVLGLIFITCLQVITVVLSCSHAPQPVAHIFFSFFFCSFWLLFAYFSVLKKQKETATRTLSLSLSLSLSHTHTHTHTHTHKHKHMHMYARAWFSHVTYEVLEGKGSTDWKNLRSLPV